MVARVRFFPIGNADTCVIDADGRKFVFDFAAPTPQGSDDRRIDLAKTLRAELKREKRGPRRRRLVQPPRYRSLRGARRSSSTSSMPRNIRVRAVSASGRCGCRQLQSSRVGGASPRRGESFRLRHATDCVWARVSGSSPGRDFWTDG